jgi:hypothetical protein
LRRGLNFPYGERDGAQVVDEIGREIAATRQSGVSQTAVI